MSVEVVVVVNSEASKGVHVYLMAMSSSPRCCAAEPMSSSTTNRRPLSCSTRASSMLCSHATRACSVSPPLWQSQRRGPW